MFFRLFFLFQAVLPKNPLYSTIITIHRISQEKNNQIQGFFTLFCFYSLSAIHYRRSCGFSLHLSKPTGPQTISDPLTARLGFYNFKKKTLTNTPKLPILTPMHELKNNVPFLQKTHNKTSHFFAFFHFFPQNLPSFCVFFQFSILLLLPSVAAKNRTKRASIQKQNRIFQKIFYPFPNKRLQIFPRSNRPIFRTNCASPSNYREASFPSPLK